ncbi:MAG: hypothetical protein ISS79_12230 [Phycisphaerae bacterium]|nr:hypothetical protein [Phycisphaerae bacterium]
MKKHQFLLLDAGPIIKLFEMDIWDAFIEKCAVTISRTVADEAKWASGESEDVRIDLSSYEEKGHIQVIDLDSSLVRVFYDRFDRLLKAEIHSGEKETLAFLCDSSDDWFLCSGDGAVFRVLGLLGKGEQGISLEEIMEKIGLSKGNLDWEYTKRFRERYTSIGQADSIQGRGFI